MMYGYVDVNFVSWIDPELSNGNDLDLYYNQISEQYVLILQMGYLEHFED